MKLELKFVLVNFNNSLLTIDAIKSIYNIKGIGSPFVIIVDNNSKVEDYEILCDFISESNYGAVLLKLNDNVGYFKAINEGLKKMYSIGIDMRDVVVGNNDVKFSDTFYEFYSDKISELSKYPVISPNIITLDGVHQNPHVISGISPFRKFVYKLYFSSYYLSVLINIVAYITASFTKRKDTALHKKSGAVLQGYGAMYILTKKFFDHFKYLLAPVFLMGEEYFISHQVYSNGMKIFYEPSLIVYHREHASVGKLYTKKMWKITRNSYHIYKNYL